MKLFAYTINGTPVNEINGYLISDLNGNAPYVSSTASSIDGYVDISSMENWNSSVLLDWSRRRDEISVLFYAEAGAQLQNFSGMSTTRKLLACSYFLIPYNIRTLLISDAQDEANWAYLLEMTKESRIACTEAMRKYAGQYIRTGLITLAQTQQFYKDVRPHVQNFNEVNSPDLKQWITNEVASSYENDGFAQKSYYSTALRDGLMNIYNGNY